MWAIPVGVLDVLDLVQNDGLECSIKFSIDPFCCFLCACHQVKIHSMQHNLAAEHVEKAVLFACLMFICECQPSCKVFTIKHEASAWCSFVHKP